MGKVVEKITPGIMGIQKHYCYVVKTRQESAHTHTKRIEIFLRRPFPRVGHLMILGICPNVKKLGSCIEKRNVEPVKLNFTPNSIIKLPFS